jgi:hypothetical protein
MGSSPFSILDSAVWVVRRWLCDASRANKLGVIVGALLELVLVLPFESIVIVRRRLWLPISVTPALGGLGLDGGSGEDRADWYTSNIEEDGVW